MSCMSKTTSSARERELFRYYQPADLVNYDEEEKTVKRSSNDPCLTAFAQLGALRLQARRGLITLSTRETVYILAESGQALSLQEDDDENDKLWHGVGILQKKNTGMGPAITDLFSQPENAPTHVLVGDLTKDDRFKNTSGVVGEPYLKAMACVPLRSALHNMVIGTYIVVDDKVRTPLSAAEKKFLTDMATTVSDYLEADRMKKIQHRSERMVKAIGLFIEGKSSLRDWWLERGHKLQHGVVKKRGRDATTTPLEHQADMEFGVQEAMDYFSRNGLHGLQNGDHRASMATSPGSSTPTHSGPSSLSGTTSVKDDEPRENDGRVTLRPALPSRDTFLSVSEITNPLTFASRSWGERNSSVTTIDTVTEPTPEPEKHHSVSFDLPPEQPQHPNSHELQNALLTSDVRGVFARASNLIREAIGVEGVVYFDASVGSFGGSSENNVMEEKAPGAFSSEGTIPTSEEDVGKKSSDTDGEKQPAPDSDSCCNVLGFSTRRRSSLHGHRVSDELQEFPEHILRRLLKRYPHGKVFNFDEEGAFSASESDNIPSTTVEEAQPKPPSDIQSHKPVSREQEAAAILSVLPNARSVFWFPLWDQNRERWYSGSLIWSTRATRTLCPIEDITYLAAFGNSTMAEISRLSAQVLSKMKTDFISSISHELRSPLHGVLASVEFLQETDMTETQIDMVNNIHASGKVLLDTINHVLDFSKVNRRSKNKKRIPKRMRKRTERRETIQVDDGIEKADVCIVSEEVLESTHAGYIISKKASSTPGKLARHSSYSGDKDAPVTVIVDVAWRADWTFEIDKGAWRRIILNLFGNAMKYTGSGFVKVSLEIEAHERHRKKQGKEYLVLKVLDSGKGIGQEFLKHHLYKPFTQEDNLATGAGLGLSIVKAIVQDMGGRVEITSEPGTGTEVTVRIPLVPSMIPKKVEERVMATEVRSKCTGLKLGLVGFDRYPDLQEEPTGILDREAEAAMLLKGAVKRVFRDWYGVEVATNETPDVVVIMEAGLGEKSLLDVLEHHGHGDEISKDKRVAIVLTSRYHSGPKVDAHEHFRIFYLQQPFGPHKVARILHQAFVHPEASMAVLPASTDPIPNKQLVCTITPASEPFTPEPLASPTATIDFASPFPTPEPTPTKHHRSFLWTPPSQQSQLPLPVVTNPETISNPSNTQIAPPTPPASQKSPDDNPGLRVLLVEDNEINLKLLVATMRKLKLEHATAMNGLEALNTYKDCFGNFDVVFMDISMPIMSGIESTRHIRRFEKENNLAPVALIALTGAANANTRQEAFSSGIDLFLTKPVPMKALRGMLDDLRREGRSAFAG